MAPLVMNARWSQQHPLFISIHTTRNSSPRTLLPSLSPLFLVRLSEWQQSRVHSSFSNAKILRCKKVEFISLFSCLQANIIFSFKLSKHSEKQLELAMCTFVPESS